MKTQLNFTIEDAKKWTKDYPTPFYIYDEEEIRTRVRRVNEAFSWNEGYREYFAVKATPTTGLMKVLYEEGCGFDCASETEIKLAMMAGAKNHEMIFTSNETSDSDYKAALDAGAIINLDAFEQIENLKAVAKEIPDTICLRYNPGVFPIPASFIGKLDESKFGMTNKQMLDGIKELQKLGVKHFGIHAMLAGGCLNEEYYPLLAGEDFKLVAEIKEKLGVEIEFIDLAGGIGINYEPGQKEVDILKVGAGVKEMYQKYIEPLGIKLRLCTEMGRYITGPAGYLITKVIGYKNTYRNYIGVDANMCNLMRPGMYGSYHNIVVLGKENEDRTEVYDVVGSICENNDKFAIQRKLPKIEKGDLLVIEDAGAHAHSMGFNYNGKLRSAEFLLKKDKSLKMIRRAQTIEDLFATLV